MVAGAPWWRARGAMPGQRHRRIGEETRRTRTTRDMIVSPVKANAAGTTARAAPGKRIPKIQFCTTPRVWYRETKVQPSWGRSRRRGRGDGIGDPADGPDGEPGEGGIARVGGEGREGQGNRRGGDDENRRGGNDAQRQIPGGTDHRDVGREEDRDQVQEQCRKSGDENEVGPEHKDLARKVFQPGDRSGEIEEKGARADVLRDQRWSNHADHKDHDQGLGIAKEEPEKEGPDDVAIGRGGEAAEKILDGVNRTGPREPLLVDEESGGEVERRQPGGQQQAAKPAVVPGEAHAGGGDGPKTEDLGDDGALPGAIAQVMDRHGSPRARLQGRSVPESCARAPGADADA